MGRLVGAGRTAATLFGEVDRVLVLSVAHIKLSLARASSGGPSGSAAGKRGRARPEEDNRRTWPIIRLVVLMSQRVFAIK